MGSGAITAGGTATGAADGAGSESFFFSRSLQPPSSASELSEQQRVEGAQVHLAAPAAGAAAAGAAAGRAPLRSALSASELRVSSLVINASTLFDEGRIFGAQCANALQISQPLRVQLQLIRAARVSQQVAPPRLHVHELGVTAIRAGLAQGFDVERDRRVSLPRLQLARRCRWLQGACAALAVALGGATVAAALGAAVVVGAAVAVGGGRCGDSRRGRWRWTIDRCDRSGRCRGCRGGRSFGRSDRGGLLRR